LTSSSASRRPAPGSGSTGPRAPAHDLVRIAGAASSWGVRLVFAGMDDRSTGDLVRIATAGEVTAEFEG
jgi:hypothetical protein